MPALHAEDRLQCTLRRKKASACSTSPTFEESCSGASTASPRSYSDHAERSERRLTDSNADADVISGYKVEQVHRLQTRVIDMDCRVREALRRVEEVSGVARAARGISSDNKERVCALEKRLDRLETAHIPTDVHNPGDDGQTASRLRHLEDTMRSLEEAVRYLEVQKNAKDGPSASKTASSDPALRRLPADTRNSGASAIYCYHGVDPPEVGSHRGGDLPESVDIPHSRTENLDSTPCSSLDKQAEFMDSVLRRLTCVESRLSSKDSAQESEAPTASTMDKQTDAMESVRQRLTRIESSLQSGAGVEEWRESQTKAMQSFLRRLDRLEDSCPRSHDLELIITATLEKAVNEKMASVMARSPTKRDLSSQFGTAMPRIHFRGAGSGEQPDSLVGSTGESTSETVAVDAHRRTLATSSSLVPLGLAQPSSEQARSPKSPADDGNAHAPASCDMVLDKASIDLECAVTAHGALAPASTDCTGTAGKPSAADDAPADAVRGSTSAAKSNDSQKPRQEASARVNVGVVTPSLGKGFSSSFIRQCKAAREERQRAAETAQLH